MIEKWIVVNEGSLLRLAAQKQQSQPNLGYPN
jgi:hypothetical protein